MSQQIKVTRELDARGATKLGFGFDLPGVDYYVDTTLGHAGNDGLGWGSDRALKTIGQAMTKAAAYGTSLAQRRGRVRIFVAPGAYNEDVVTPLNTECPFGQLIAVNPTRQSFGAAYIYASTALTYSVIVRARGWLISGFEIGAVASAGSVWLDGSTANSSAQGTEISDCLMGGWAATSANGIDVTGNGAPFTVLRNLHFDGYPGSAIKCSSSSTDQPRFWEIDHCVFVDNTNHINMNPRGFKESWIHDCAFMQIGANRTATAQIDNTGGNASIIGPNNFLSGDYDSATGGYTAGSNETWRGNHTQDSIDTVSGSAGQANPA